MINIKLLKINMIPMVLMLDGKHTDTNKRYDPNGFNINGKHKDTKDKYDPYGFDINGKHKDTNDEYDPNGFDIYYTHKDTDDIYDPNGFDINGKHKDTKNKYDPNGFDINGKHKDTGTFLDKKNDIRKDISKNKGKIRTDQARSSEDQKGKGYVDLPIIRQFTYLFQLLIPLFFLIYLFFINLL